MRRVLSPAVAFFAAAAVAVLLALATATSAQATHTTFTDTVTAILGEPYQPDYVPLGFDAAFPGMVPNVHPVEDYTSGSRQGMPDAAPWPPAFKPVTIKSLDGAPLLGYVARRPGSHPGVVVVHGFNSNAKDSVVRWAAMLYANGYNVAAIDLRNFPPEYRAGYGHPNWLQTFGWKEASDVIAAGRFLKSQPGVRSVGVVGFSLGGATTVLAMARDSYTPTFSAGLNFSGPADQNSQIYSTAVPANCQTPLCTFPATSALMAVVVPPNTYTDPCRMLTDSAAYYRTTPYGILAQDDAYHKQLRVRVPLLSFYTKDDPLVADFQARMMAGYTSGTQQRTIELTRGLHAYFNDRWWQQRAILLYFKRLLPWAASDPTITTWPTVNQTPGGIAAGHQQVNLGSPTRAQADALAAPYICDTTQRSPALTATP